MEAGKLNQGSIYLLLYGMIGVVGLANVIYHFHRYEIGDSSKLNKYRLSPNHILIKLRLFKYNNNFNYFLLIPYLIAWILFFIIFILYIIYWCGIKILEVFFLNQWVNIALLGLILAYMSYALFIEPKIRDSNQFESPDFVMNSEEKKDKKDEQIESSTTQV